MQRLKLRVCVVEKMQNTIIILTSSMPFLCVLLRSLRRFESILYITNSKLQSNSLRESSAKLRLHGYGFDASFMHRPRGIIFTVKITFGVDIPKDLC